MRDSWFCDEHTYVLLGGKQNFTNGNLRIFCGMEEKSSKLTFILDAFSSIHGVFKLILDIRELIFIKEHKIANWYIELISILIFWSKWTYFGLSINFGQKRPNFGQKGHILDRKNFLSKRTYFGPSKNFGQKKTIMQF